MPASQRRIAATAPHDRWVLLGKLLEDRRRMLGYTYRTPGFERERGVNRRMASDLERAAPERVDHFTEGTLRLAAHGYQVTYESVLAVLSGKADALSPVGAAAPGEPPGWRPPLADAARVAALRPDFDEINERRVALAAQGITSPSGAQMFGEGTDDALTWDGTAGRRVPIKDRVWLIAELRRQEAALDNGPEANPGALVRGYVAGHGGLSYATRDALARRA